MEEERSPAWEAVLSRSHRLRPLLPINEMFANSAKAPTKAPNISPNKASNEASTNVPIIAPFKALAKAVPPLRMPSARPSGRSPNFQQRLVSAKKLYNVVFDIEQARVKSLAFRDF